MKNVLLKCLVCGLLIFLLIGCGVLNENETFEIDEDIIALELVKMENCNNEVDEYYINYDKDRKVYFICLDEIYIKRENTKTITLKYHFDNVNQSFDASIDQLINQMELVNSYKDGGSKMYQKDNYRILECKTIDGNRDIYFGDITLEYQNDYCMNK